MSFSINFKKPLSHFNLEIQDDLPSGQLIGILGSSGSGKSTFLNCLSNATSYEGSWNLNGQTHLKVGIVFQNYEIFPHLNVYENIQYGMRWLKLPTKLKEKTILKWSENLKIEHLLSRNSHSLSGGEMQRVALAQSLVLSPDILLLDEPTSSLDTHLKYQFLELISDLQKTYKFSLFWVTHNFQEVLRFADWAIYLEKGEIIQKDTPKNIFENPSTLRIAQFSGIINHIESTPFYIRPHHIRISDIPSSHVYKLQKIYNHGMYLLGKFLRKEHCLLVFLTHPLEIGKNYFLNWQQKDLITFDI